MRAGLETLLEGVRSRVRSRPKHEACAAEPRRHVRFRLTHPCELGGASLGVATNGVSETKIVQVSGGCHRFQHASIHQVNIRAGDQYLHLHFSRGGDVCQ